MHPVDHSEHISSLLVKENAKQPDIVTRRGIARPAFLKGAVALWICSLLAGISLLTLYAKTPGSAAALSDYHALDKGVAKTASAKPVPVDSFVLKVFLHPHCPCSRATVAELARLTLRCGGRLHVEAVVFQAASAEDAWRKSEIIESLHRLPGVVIHTDWDAAEAKRHGVRTSGQVLLYNQAGKLRFNGGITPARGHSGDNVGSDAIAAMVMETPASKDASSKDAISNDTVRRSPVFGCRIQ